MKIGKYAYLMYIIASQCMCMNALTALLRKCICLAKRDLYVINIKVQSDSRNMAANGEEQISDQEKIRIASDLIRYAPPGEFNEVFTDLRMLLNDDTLLKEGVAGACALYDKDQLTPVKLPNASIPSLVTEHNDNGGGRF